MLPNLIWVRMCNRYHLLMNCPFQHCTDYITMGSFMGRGNQYIQLVKVLYCNLPTNGKGVSLLLEFLHCISVGSKPGSYMPNMTVHDLNKI